MRATIIARVFFGTVLCAASLEALTITVTPRHITERWPLETLHQILQNWSSNDPLDIPRLLGSTVLDFARIYEGLVETVERQQEMRALYWQTDGLDHLLYTLPKLQNNLRLAESTLFLQEPSNTLHRGRRVTRQYRGPIGVERLQISLFGYEQRRHLVALMLADYPARMPSARWQSGLLRKLSANSTKSRSAIVTLLLEAWPLLTPVTLANLIYRLDSRSFAALLVLLGTVNNEKPAVAGETMRLAETTLPSPSLVSPGPFSRLLKAVLGAASKGALGARSRVEILIRVSTRHHVEKDKDASQDTWLSALTGILKAENGRFDAGTVQFVEHVLGLEIAEAKSASEMALIKGVWLQFHIWTSRYWWQRHSRPGDLGKGPSLGQHLLARLEVLIRSTSSTLVPVEQRSQLYETIFKAQLQGEREETRVDVDGNPPSFLEALEVGGWMEGTAFDHRLVWNRYFRASRKMAPAKKLIIKPRELDERYEEHLQEPPDVLDSLHFLGLLSIKGGRVALNRRLPWPRRIESAGKRHLYMVEMIEDRTRLAYSVAYGMLRELSPESGSYCWVQTASLADIAALLYSLPFLLHLGMRINMTPFPDKHLPSVTQTALTEAFLTKLCPSEDGGTKTHMKSYSLSGFLALSLMDSLALVREYATWEQIYVRLSLKDKDR